jgi:hypothetical protein
MKTSIITRRFAIGLLAVSLFAACKKESTDPVQPGILPYSLPCLDKKLSLSTYTMDPAADLNGDGKPDADLLAFMRPCDRDNTIVFEKGGKLTGDNGALRCDDDVAQSGTAGTWTYDEPSKRLRITSATDKTDVSEWTVLSATASQLTVQTAVVEDGVTYKGVMTWKLL